MAIVLVIGGLVLLSGGWTVARSGDVVNAFPFWVLGIGSALVGGGAYLYLMSLP